jgi:hypothetical protein
VAEEIAIVPADVAKRPQCGLMHSCTIRLKTGQASISPYAEASNEKPLNGLSGLEPFEASVGDRVKIAGPSTFSAINQPRSAPSSAVSAVISAKPAQVNELDPARTLRARG